jgi:deoxyribodipyrimidine photo-lyase
MDNIDTRIRTLKSTKSVGDCVLYVMSRDQRVSYNHALLAAQNRAQESKLPLCVVFCLYEKSGVRAREHYEFMLSGLKVVEKDLAELNIPFMMLIGSPEETLSAVFHHTKPEAVYFDFSPLRGPIGLHQKLAEKHDISMYEVDTHNIVPAWVVSPKVEVGARTLRTKIHKILAHYLYEPQSLRAHPYPWPGTIVPIVQLNDQIDNILNSLSQNGAKIDLSSGESFAKQALEQFTRGKLKGYSADRNDPSLDGQSGLSPYLHFGQLSSLEVAVRLQMELQKNNEEIHLFLSPKMPHASSATSLLKASVDALLEELIVRKELSDNFCFYAKDYDRLESAPEWARASLSKHSNDQPEYIYTRNQLERAETHDEAWNAAQLQLTTTGKMHGYMRMYWAKKVLEWSIGPEEAIGTLIYLNDFYSLDGGDPNGYAGILWSVAGVHDRPWGERDIFGSIRYMNYAGLRRKFNIGAYEERWCSKS